MDSLTAPMECNSFMHGKDLQGKAAKELAKARHDCALEAMQRAQFYLRYSKSELFRPKWEREFTQGQHKSFEAEYDRAFAELREAKQHMADCRNKHDWWELQHHAPNTFSTKSI